MIKRLDSIIGNFFGKDHLKDEGVIVSEGLRKTVVVQVISSALVFVSSLLLVRFSSIAEYGIYVHIFNWISILVLIACFGMEDYVLAEIPMLVKNKEHRAVYRMWVNINRLFLLIACLVSAVFISLVFLDVIPGLWEHRYLFLLALVNIFFSGFIILNQQVLQALNRIYSSQIADKIVKPLLMIIGLLIVVYFAYGKLDARLLVLCNTIAVIASAIVVIVLIRKKIPRSGGLQASERSQQANTIIKAGYFLAISLLILLKSRVCMLFLGSMRETADVGVFNIASRLSDFVLLPYVLIHAVVPQLFARQTDAAPAYRRRTYNKITQLITLASGFVMLAFVVLGREVLSWYDESLTLHYDILLILCASQLLYSLFGPASAIIMMQGKQKLAAIALLVDIVVSSFFFFLFINSYGLEGAAWATLCGSFIYNIILRSIVNRHLSLSEASLNDKTKLS